MLREISQRDEYEASLTWLGHLAVGVEDLIKRPNAAMVMKFLFARQIAIHSAMEECGESSSAREHVLESSTSPCCEPLDQAMWRLPELQNKLVGWTIETASRHEYQGPPLTLSQAVILLNVCRFLEQEPEQSPGWAEECLRSALSSDFFEKAANPTK